MKNTLWQMAELDEMLVMIGYPGIALRAALGFRLAQLVDRFSR
jgi:hypothetical protein